LALQPTKNSFVFQHAPWKVTMRSAQVSDGGASGRSPAIATTRFRMYTNGHFFVPGRLKRILLSIRWKYPYPEEIMRSRACRDGTRRHTICFCSTEIGRQSADKLGIGL